MERQLESSPTGLPADAIKYNRPSFQKAVARGLTMAQEKKPDAAVQEPVKRFESSGSLSIGGKKLSYTATAAWQPLFEGDKEKAEVFHTYYRVGRRDAGSRALTFVFNGGPGAASAYLHMGAIGPRRIETNKDGTLPASPVRLVDNAQTWLAFTDLVFVDPVGTGLSRAKPEEDKEKADKSAEPGTFYWDVANDLSALCDFITGFLSREGRWRSPIFLAGESYGGYRAARLVRQLQDQAGVGLSGAMLISPALEWDSLFSSRFNVLARALGIPSYAAAARFHGRCKAAKRGESLPAFLERAEEYALESFLPAAARGDGRPDKAMKAAYGELADWIGLDVEIISKHSARVGMRTFARELLRDQDLVVGVYDAAVTSRDPLPITDSFAGVDPTLGGLNRLYTAGANAHIREGLGVESERKYELLNFTVNRGWQWRDQTTGSPVPPGATDDLAVGLAMNPSMKLMIVHGIYDLITPYFESKHLLRHLRQDSRGVSDIELRTYEGGHMFYMWEKSRRAFTADAKKLIGG